ncbi:SCO family protein [Aquimarina sp. MMG015]|uniref:SCO family protein n=1 Tax=unclassified Aquimarina TaxID=2627091 RepID=UPI000E50BBAA|nr:MULTISPECIES: SCO family protein [unclassified Aquimarina]AXT57834.1 SCO family protein [Aquimarina sp. AD1]MBQ4803224.1 SCO family protein [Aquimarina sp. MMG015]RKN35006.1 SCO family protein [Aquimarina sp. AD1]
MKKYSYVGISFIILIFGIIFIPKIVNRVKDTSIVKNDRMSADNPVANEKLSYIKINGKPRKVPEFAFLNQDSLLITNHDYKGKVYVVDFFFTSCPTICPKMSRNLAYLQNKLKDYQNFGIASFTINPKRDTPRILKKYAENYGIVNPDWHLLTGEREDLYELANAGFNIYAAENPEVPGGFEHNGYFALIDQEGYIRSRYDASGNPIIYYRGTIGVDEKKDENGEEEQVTILLEDIKKLLKENE